MMESIRTKAEDSSSIEDYERKSGTTRKEAATRERKQSERSGKILDQQLKVSVPLVSSSQCCMWFVRMVKVMARCWNEAPQQFGAENSQKLASCGLFFLKVPALNFIPHTGAENSGYLDSCIFL